MGIFLVASEGLVAMFQYVRVSCIYMKGLEDPDKQEWKAERVLLLVLVSLFLF